MLESQLMSEIEVAKVTGFSALSKQCQVLSDHGIFYVKDRNGCPHVTWYSFNHPSHLRFNHDLVNNEPDFSGMGKQ